MERFCRFRIGQGYDIHRTCAGKRLVLGGIVLDHSYGLDGHSDADCLSHAIADALLGAAGLPDIGHFFPNTDPSIEGIDSQKILRFIHNELTNRSYVIGNIDATLIAEEPKIAPHLEAMRSKLAASLSIDPSQLGLKATTNEKIDDIGAKKAMAAHAVALIYQEPKT